MFLCSLLLLAIHIHYELLLLYSQEFSKLHQSWISHHKLKKCTEATLKTIDVLLLALEKNWNKGEVVSTVFTELKHVCGIYWAISPRVQIILI